MTDYDSINDTGKIPLDIVKLESAAELPKAERSEIIIISGMSGAGRSRAAATLEDLGWYVIDNLPPRLLLPMAGLIGANTSVKQLACVVDVRSREFFVELLEVLATLREQHYDYRIVFLDASDAALVQRFENVRRPHPLQENGSLLQGIQKERQTLAELKSRADVIIDTSNLSVHDLARKIRNNVTSSEETKVKLTVMSFGFKYGIPLDADYVADVRFIPNPYWVTELRHLTGKDAPVREFVLGIDGVEKFAADYAALIHSTVAGYEHELKPYVTIAVGCTGGKHRSVAIAEEISRRLQLYRHTVRTLHRDLGRE